MFTIAMKSVHLPAARQRCGLMARRTNHLSHNHLLNAFGNLQMSLQERLSRSDLIIRADRNCPPNVLYHLSITWSVVPAKQKAAGLQYLRSHRLHICHRVQRLISIPSDPCNLVPFHHLHIDFQNRTHISILTQTRSLSRLFLRCLHNGLRGQHPRRKGRPITLNFHRQ